MANMSPAPPMVSRPKPPSFAKTFWKMILAESMAKNAVVNGTPFRAACENSRASIGRVRTMPCVSVNRDPYNLKLFFVDRRDNRAPEIGAQANPAQ